MSKEIADKLGDLKEKKISFETFSNFLTKKGVNDINPNYTNSDGYTILELATLLDVETLKLVYNKFIELDIDAKSYLESPGIRGLTALHIAVYKKNYKTVNFLLEDVGISPDVLDSNRQQTPLFTSIQYNLMPIFRLLLLHGAKTDVVDLYNLDPLSFAVKFKKYEMIKYLLKRSKTLQVRPFLKINGRFTTTSDDAPEEESLEVSLLFKQELRNRRFKSKVNGIGKFHNVDLYLKLCDTLVKETKDVNSLIELTHELSGQPLEELNGKDEKELCKIIVNKLVNIHLLSIVEND